MKLKTKWKIATFFAPVVFWGMIILAGIAILDSASQNNNTVKTNSLISDEVAKYRPQVAEACAKYGIGDYVELCLAVMQQESGGRGTDVMQSSESLGLAPNTIGTDQSIDQGVKMLAGYIQAAKVESPADIERIKLVLQSYNYGNGYLTWAVNRDGGYTQENAVEFARIHSKGVKRRDTSSIAANAGLWSYGDQYYVDHVLRYYQVDEAGTGSAGDIGLTDVSSENPYGEAIITEAFKHKGKPYVWGAAGPNTFDCSGFVYYVYKVVGVYNGPRATTKSFINMGTEIPLEQAQPGDMVIFTKQGASAPHHMGIYLGNNKMIHAPRSNDVVKEASIYYSKRQQKINVRRL